MSIKVTRDGQIMPILQGYTEVAGHRVAMCQSKVCYANETFDDEQVPEDLLETIKAGDHRGFVFFEGDEPEDRSPDGSPAPKAGEDPQGSRGDKASPKDEGRTDEGESQDLYDPSKHNQNEVLAYLKTADVDEVKRVQEVEKAGHDRDKIAAFEAKE
jgi:hypothetical protein